jgi:5-methylcytosine-specific restriction protein A
VFILNHSYSRQDIWEKLYPYETYVKGGDWFTDYTAKNGFFIIFANVNSTSSTGNSYPNRIGDDGLLEWFGKANAHSAQKNLNALLKGELKPLVFFRHDPSTPSFSFYGSPRIKNFKDNCRIRVAANGADEMIETININFYPTQSHIPEVIEEKEESELVSIEGARVQVYLNRYERDPALRKRCAELFGYDCAACGFSFAEKYGEFGIDYCHVHHITPLSELGGTSVRVDPKSDLIPLCANCHAMVHRVSPALSLLELKNLIKTADES